MDRPGIFMLKNREQAAQILAKKLHAHIKSRPLVLAIPRGAVGMGAIIADALQGELDVILVHKLSHPTNSEFAIGAVDEDGQVYMDKKARFDEIPIRYLETERQKQLEVLKKRRQRYTPIRASLDPKNKVVIIIDDGAATGWTIKAALLAIRERKPKKIIVALGVSSPKAIKELKLLANEVICLEIPENFLAVSQFYEEFPQVSDEEVEALLARA